MVGYGGIWYEEKISKVRRENVINWTVGEGLSDA